MGSNRSDDNYQILLYKSTFHYNYTAAEDSKKKGTNIDKSISQLTDADMETLRHYVQNNVDGVRKQVPFVNLESSLKVDDIENDGDVIDETTSVLSYGDDEVAEIDDDGDDIYSSGSVAMAAKSHSPTGILSQSSDEENSDSRQLSDRNNNGDNKTKYGKKYRSFLY